MNRVVDPVLNRGRRVEAGRVFEDLRAVVRWPSRVVISSTIHSTA